MPVLQPALSAAYDPVQLVLQTARERLHDRMPTLASYSGNILANTNADTQAATNAAWRHLQEYLTNSGLTTLIGDTVLSGLPACTNLDPASQAFISWTGCSDGNNVFIAPVLPENLMYPLKLWERQSGSNMPFIEPPMELMLDGIPARPKESLNRIWEWREDIIFVPGAQQATDLRVRYLKYLPDFNDVGAVQWFDQSVPIVRASDALAWFLVAEIVAHKDTEAAAASLALGEAAARKIINRDVKAKQRVNVRRQPRSGNSN